MASRLVQEGGELPGKGRLITEGRHIAALHAAATSQAIAIPAGGATAAANGGDASSERHEE